MTEMVLVCSLKSYQFITIKESWYSTFSLILQSQGDIQAIQLIYNC